VLQQGSVLPALFFYAGNMPGMDESGDGMTQVVQGNSDADANANARADLCRFLSACYYEPIQDFAEERLFDSMLAAAAAVHPELAEQARRLGVAFAAQDLQALLVDYTRLFLGPLQALATPYGSAWLNRELAQAEDQTAAVRELYAQGGFDIGEDVADLPDHVAVELEFLYLLLFTQREAMRSGNADELAAVQILQRRFLDEQLGAWIGAFAARVKGNAATAFYRELAALTERFVRMEADAGVAAPS
jgi:TorA maturation chaperone TorD